MNRIIQIGIVVVLLAAAVLFAGDYLSLRYQIPNRAQFGSVVVRQSYAIPQKNRSTEYVFDPPAPQTCVNSLFPHMGNTPCWYLKRHARQQTNVGGAMHTSPY